jgi:hypothetical protein
MGLLGRPVNGRRIWPPAVYRLDRLEETTDNAAMSKKQTRAVNIHCGIIATS